MKLEIQWLVTLGVDQNLLDHAVCLTLAEELGPQTDIVEFAETLLKKRACNDFDALQTLVEDAYERSLASPPPSNPFNVPIHPPENSLPTTEEATTAALQFPESMPDLDKLEHVDSKDAAITMMQDLLHACYEMGASDLHLSANARPFIRKNRAIHFLHNSPLAAEVSERLNTALLSPEQLARFTERSDLDLALPLGPQERYRVNLMVHKDGLAGTYRLIPHTILQLEELGFEDLGPIKKLLSYNNGLILVAGPVGAGKTVTLSAMIDTLNRTREDHLIAVEEPIEVVQRSKHCHITQREVGLHARSFASALKSALRQDPDIIVIGEMRDLATIEMAISASETGHLVIGTLHTSDAANTLNRVLDVFPAAQQTQIRVMLSHALRGIICQNLIPAANGGMALAYELLINNTAVCSLIQDNKPEGLVNVMETGSAEGMRLMDKSVLSLWEKDLITDAVAVNSLKSSMKRQQLRELIKLQKPTHLSA